MNVVIAGGGIGGLALTALLRQGGHTVAVHERAESLPTTGTTLGMWPGAMRVLDRIGVADRIREQGVRQRAGELRRWDGRVVSRVDVRAEVWLVDRPHLLAALAEAAGDVRFGEPVDDWRSTGADLVVGADGVHSRIRGAISPAPVRRPGVTIWRGVADLPRVDAVESWGPDALFGMTPKPGGLTNWFATWRRRPAEAPDALPDLFEGWHAGVREVLSATDPALTIRHEAVLAPRLARYVAPDQGVALIGDAAHAMMPNLGRGACETLLDAEALAEALGASTLHDALSRYDRRRRRASRRIAVASSVAARVATASRGRGARDLLLRSVSRFA